MESVTRIYLLNCVPQIALVIHANHLLRMIEYTETILISNRLNLQPAKLLIEINIFWTDEKL